MYAYTHTYTYTRVYTHKHVYPTLTWDNNIKLDLQLIRKKQIYLFWVYHKNQILYSSGRDGKGGEKFTWNIMNTEYNTKQPNQQDKLLNKSHVFTLKLYWLIGYPGG